MAKVKTFFKKGPPRHFVKQWRTHRGYTQEKLAEIADVSHGAISQLETAKVAYTQGMLEALAAALSCEPGDLISRNPLDENAEWRILEGLAPTERQKALDYIRMLKLAAENENKAA